MALPFLREAKLWKNMCCLVMAVFLLRGLLGFWCWICNSVGIGRDLSVHDLDGNYGFILKVEQLISKVEQLISKVEQLILKVEQLILKVEQLILKDGQLLRLILPVLFNCWFKYKNKGKKKSHRSRTKDFHLRHIVLRQAQHKPYCDKIKD